MSEPDRPGGSGQPAGEPDGDSTVEYSRESAQLWRDETDERREWPAGDSPPAYGGSRGFSGGSDWSSGGGSATSIYPVGGYPATGQPAYAPAGYPAEPVGWAPEPVAARYPLAPTPPPPPSRVVPGVLAALIGLVVVALGMYLLVRFGADTLRIRREQLSSPLLQPVLAIVGAVLIALAVALNGWSPWATLLPGIALTGAGAWAFVSATGLERVISWTNWAFKNQELGAWYSLGGILVLGLVLLGASVAATAARAGGRWAGRYSAER